MTRVGRKITMTKITMNWNVAMPSAAVGGGSLRFKVVYDKQTNGAAPSILGFLQWIISTPIITRQC